MKRHKWGKCPVSKDVCQKCGVKRDWVGGAIQTWEYCVKVQYPTGLCGPPTKTTFARPDCLTSLANPA